MIVVVADNPSMGATYRMPQALAPLAKDGKVRTIVKQLDGWREWKADYVLTNSVILADPSPARKMIESADWLLVMGISGLDVIDQIYEGDIDTETSLPPIVAYHVESFYRGDRSVVFNARLANDLPGAATFAMPDLWAGGQCPPGTVPLLQPMEVPSQPPPKPPVITVVHSPGTEKKAVAKGTETIRDGFAIAAEHIGHYDIDLNVIIGESHAKTLEWKRNAHIVIDQVPPDGYPAGLGNSGCEGLALACHTISRYNVDTSAYFANPPVINAINAQEVARAISQYAIQGATMRNRIRQRSWAWAKAHLDINGSWLAYFRKHLPPSILERCK